MARTAAHPRKSRPPQARVLQELVGQLREALVQAARALVDRTRPE